jgi:hypothetical protein
MTARCSSAGARDEEVEASDAEESTTGKSVQKSVQPFVQKYSA